MTQAELEKVSGLLQEAGIRKEFWAVVGDEVVVDQYYINLGSVTDLANKTPQEVATQITQYYDDNRKTLR